MASPFRHFRKYTGLTMVVLTAFLMFAFVLIEPLMTYFGSGAGAGNRSGAKEVAVTWDDGDLSEGELANLVNRRQIVANIHQGVFMLGYQSALQDGVADLPLRVAPLQLPATMEQGIERNVVRTKIFADAARKLGMVVSNETVKEYLQALGRDRVSNDDLRTLMSKVRLGNGQRMTIDMMFDLFRESLLARNFVSSYAYTFETVLPQERYRDWLDVNDRVVVEAAAVRAEDLVGEVADPTDAELTAFYEEYKNRVAQPDRVGMVELASATPGFATPRRVTLQYIKGDFNKVSESLIDKVTDEEIAEYYDANKDQFIKADDLLSDDLGEDPLTEADPEDDSADESSEEQSKESEEKSEEATSETTTEEKPTEEKPAAEAEKAEELAEEEAKPEATKPETETAAEPTSEKPAAEDSGSNDRRSPFRFVALQEEEKPEAEVAAEEAAADEPATDEPATEESDDLFEGVADSEADKAAAEKSRAEAAAKAAAMAKEKGDDTEDDKPVEYQPLDEVRDEIRRSIAERKSFETLRDLISERFAAIDSLYTEYFVKQTVSDSEEEIAPPADLVNLKSMADQPELEFGELGPIAFLDLREEKLGLSIEADENNPNRQRLATLVFNGAGSTLENYKPVITYDLDGNRYLVQRIADVPRETPELEAIRDEVVKAWKLQKASELALAKAKELATKAQTAGGSLTNVLGDEKSVDVVESDPFARLTIGNVSPTTGAVQLRISTPKPLVDAGPEFLDEVFKLDEGEVGAVLNHDKSIAYITRIQRHLESDEELRQAFLSEGDRWFGLQTMTQARMQSAAASLVSDLLGKSELEWKRNPDQPRLE